MLKRANQETLSPELQRSQSRDQDRHESSSFGGQSLGQSKRYPRRGHAGPGQSPVPVEGVPVNLPDTASSIHGPSRTTFSNRRRTMRRTSQKRKKL